MSATHGESLLAHGTDWAGRAIAAEAQVRRLEQELDDTRAIYLSARRDVREEFIDREVELIGAAGAAYGAYFALVNLVVLHEPILREYYEERDELPKEEFERAMHELHTSLVLRTTPVADESADDDSE